MGDKKGEKEFIAEFIEVYRSLPALWDVKCKDYTNRAKKGEQYEVLIEKYREKNPDAEKQEVIKKVNSLRTNFRKELKRIRDAEKSGAAAEDVKPTLWYFDEMRFLVTQETPTASMSTMDISEHVQEDKDHCDANETSRVNVEAPKTKGKRKALDPTEELVQLATKRLREPQEESDKLAAAWAVKLRRMEPQQQLFAEKAISDILFEGEMGTLHRNSVEINGSRASTPYSIQPIPSPSFAQYESAGVSSQNTGGYYINFQ